MEAPQPPAPATNAPKQYDFSPFDRSFMSFIAEDFRIRWVWFSLIGLLCIGVAFFDIYVGSFSAVMLFVILFTRVSSARIKLFARLNWLAYTADHISVVNNSILANRGNSQRTKFCLTEPDKWDLFGYEYTTGSGKNRQVHTFLGLRFPLKNRIHHILLDSKKNNFLGMSNLPVDYDKKHRLELEGDFNKYFDLYALEGMQIATLSLLTPDVMQLLIDLPGEYDIELVGQEGFIYMRTSQTNKENIQGLITVYEKLQDVNRRITDRLLVDVAPINSTTGEAIPMTMRRKGLKFGWVTALIVALIVLLQFGFGILQFFLVR